MSRSFIHVHALPYMLYEPRAHPGEQEKAAKSIQRLPNESEFFRDQHRRRHHRSKTTGTITGQICIKLTYPLQCTLTHTHTHTHTKQLPVFAAH